MVVLGCNGLIKIRNKDYSRSLYMYIYIYILHVYETTVVSMLVLKEGYTCAYMCIYIYIYIYYMLIHICIPHTYTPEFECVQICLQGNYASTPMYIFIFMQSGTLAQD